MKLLSSLPNPFESCTFCALSKPFWFIAHWSIEIVLSKFANNPFITKLNGLDISVAFDKPSLKFYYWFQEERSNLIFPLHLWSFLLHLFLWLLILHWFLICFLGSSPFECYTAHPEISTICRWMGCKLVFLSSASSWAPGWLLCISKWGFY